MQGFRIIAPTRLFYGNVPVCRSDAAYDKAVYPLIPRCLYGHAAN